MVLYVPVAAPAAEAEPYGLRALGTDATPPSSQKEWVGGYAYLPEMPHENVRNRDPLDYVNHKGSDLGGSADVVKVVPMLATVEDPISEMDRYLASTDDPKARVTRILEAYTSKMLEHELWTGEIATLAGHTDNPVLASSDAVTVDGSGAKNIQTAIGLMMQKLADSGVSFGMIHMPLSLSTRIPDAWRTSDTMKNFGFVVVAGSGYPGTGPSGSGTNWMYATAPVSYRLGDIEVVPGNEAEALDRTTNNLLYRAERFIASDFAGPVIACQFNPSTP